MSVMIAEVLEGGEEKKAEYEERSEKPPSLKRRQREVIIARNSALSDHVMFKPSGNTWQNLNEEKWSYRIQLST